MDIKPITRLGNEAGSGPPDNLPVIQLAGTDVPGSASPQSAAHQFQAELLASVSHELRSPLAIIKGYTATLIRYPHDLDEAERGEFLDAIRAASCRLELMVNQLLELSQLEAGILLPTFMPLNLEQLVKEAGIAFEERSRHSGMGERTVRLTALPIGQIPLVEADPRLLRHAVDNLLEDALKFSPTGDIIEVTLTVADIPDIAPVQSRLPPGDAVSANAVLITVTDSEIGVPAEQLERIFDRFHRADTGRVREVSGLGLGLAICRRIVDLHGGAVWGESQLGIGSTFFMALPVAADEAESLARTESPSGR